MAQLIWFGKEIDPSQEIEAFARDLGLLHGFQVEVKRRDADPVTLHNAHEVHNAYRPGMIAVESDYHSAGTSMEWRRLEWVRISASVEAKEIFF